MKIVEKNGVSMLVENKQVISCDVYIETHFLMRKQAESKGIGYKDYICRLVLDDFVKDNVNKSKD